MEALGLPTFGQLLQYLRDLGYRVGPGKPGYVLCEHPDEDSWFVFRDRGLENPAREGEVKEVRFQLTHRGFVSDHEFARFWATAVLGTPQGS